MELALSRKDKLTYTRRNRFLVRLNNVARKFSIKFSFLSLILFFSLGAKAQLSTPWGEIAPFGRIFTGFVYNADPRIKPGKSFLFDAGILGLDYKLNDRITAAIMYDVTRTTNFAYTDSLGISNYFEGSKYTAYLKMGQINWKFYPGFTLSVGQILSVQYLLPNDLWWGLRYVDVTAQEKFRYGMPADFGALLSYQVNPRLKIKIGAVQGEGPFRHQNEESDFLYMAKLEYQPWPGWQFNVYYDYETIHPELLKENKEVLSLFGGYKNEEWMVGVEYNSMKNANFECDHDREMVSAYSSYNFYKNYGVFVRIDYGTLQLTGADKHYYFIGGLQYTEDHNYFVSVNYRQNNYLINEDVSQYYVNFGLFF